MPKSVWLWKSGFVNIYDNISSFENLMNKINEWKIFTKGWVLHLHGGPSVYLQKGWVLYLHGGPSVIWFWKSKENFFKSLKMTYIHLNEK